MIRNHSRSRVWSRVASSAARLAAATLIAGGAFLAPPAPAQELPLRAKTATAAGVDGGQVWAWGDNGQAQLGRGAPSGAGHTPGPVSGLSGVIVISAGEYHNLALKSDGTIAAWGSSSRGALGDGGPAVAPIGSPVAVKSITGVTSVAAGDAHSLALRSDGTVWSWGNNQYGQLGDGTTVNRSVPGPVSGLTNIRAIAARYLHSLALKNDGTVWAWGYNADGALGDGTTTNRSVPVQVSVIDRIVGISAGVEHNLALRNDGTVWAWGLNARGGLGDGTAF